MRRYIGTAMAIVGLLAIATVAAAVNLNVLRSTGVDPARIDMRSVGDMTMMDATPPPPRRENPAGSEPSAPDATDLPPAPDSERVDPRPSQPSPMGPVTVPPTAKAEKSREGRPSKDKKPKARALVSGPTAGGSETRSSKSKSRASELPKNQRDLLRIAAIAHVSPRDVLAVVRGEKDVDPVKAEAIRQVAAYLGVDLRSLAGVESLPMMRDRGHGGPNDQGGMNYDS